jgi:hypothetical protein
MRMNAAGRTKDTGFTRSRKVFGAIRLRGPAENAVTAARGAVG